MSFALTFSNYSIPCIIGFIVLYGLYKKIDIFSAFTAGAYDGFVIVVKILPTLIGLLIAIDMANTSGVMSLFLKLFSPVANLFNIPYEIIPLSVVKMFSSSAATGMLIDIYKEYGPDSSTGTIASLILSSTETIFYTVSVYCVSVGVKKTRWIIPGAILASITGIVASIILGIFFCPIP